MTPDRDHLKAGIFVSAGLLLGLAVVLLLADPRQLFEHTQEVRVRFDLERGLMGLKTGALVTLGDEAVGKVAAIEDLKDAEGLVEAKVVVLRIPREYRLYRNAVVEIKSPLVGTGAALNIARVRVPAPPGADARTRALDRPYAPADLLDGTQRDLLGQAGIGPDQKRDLSRVIANIERLTTVIADAQAAPGQTNAEQLAADLRALGKALREDVPAMLASGRRVVEQAEPAMKDLRAAIAQVQVAVAHAAETIAEVRKRRDGWAEEVDQIVKSLNQSVGIIRDLLKDKDPALRQTIDHLHQLAGKLNEKTVARFTELIEQAQASMKNVQGTAAQLHDLLASQRPVLERAMANAQLATDQLKLASIEIRRSPWRLLYSPSDQELETDNLYDAARSFALAAGTLDSTVQSLRALAEKGTADPVQAQRLTEHLERTFQKYREAENAFWEQLKLRSPHPPPPATQPGR